MTTSEYFGDHQLPRSSGKFEYLTLAFSPLSTPLRSRWRNNSLSADFLGDYVVTFLPANEAVETRQQRQRDIRHAVSYIANELLENAMKYHAQDLDIPITIDLVLTKDHVSVSSTNGALNEQARRYKAFIQRLLSSGPRDLLLDQLENAKDMDEKEGSGLGLVTMLTDYDATLGWQFATDSAVAGATSITTNVLIPLLVKPGVGE